MTLKEKFHQWLRTEPYSLRDAVTLREAQCEVIADEFAIEFANWVNKVSYRSFDGNWYLTQIDEDIKKTTEELLEIYKKEKGL
jgi:hypothetical protein